MRPTSKRSAILLVIAYLALAGIALVALAATRSASARPVAREQAPAARATAVVVRPVKSDVSPPLRSTRGAPAPGRAAAALAGDIDTDRSSARPGGIDTAVQRAPGFPALIPTPSRSFDGLLNWSNVNPPDTNGDIGPDHYVQMVNLNFQVFDRAGNSLYGPAANNTLWTGFGGPCETTNRGDPIVLYDQLAGRWLLSQFAFYGATVPPFYQCIAISRSGDPTGSYQRYAYLMHNNALGDYPKFGVWPDAYYMTNKEFTSYPGGYIGVGAYAFDRAAMLAGSTDPAYQYFKAEPPYTNFLPADLDGALPPPAGSPNYMMSMTSLDRGWPQDGLSLWQFHVDWADPSRSTFSETALLRTAPFDSIFCFSDPFCVPQPDTTARLNVRAQGLMYRLAYRNLGTHEALGVNHTVDVGDDHAGVRWYEIRSPRWEPSIYQQGTYAPDADHRWMGSVAMDRMGNIGLGYSVASSTLHPSIRYTGRLVTDPLGTLPQGEASIVEGSGSQTSANGRWGDYSMMAVDPADDCTFWYTNQYYAATSFNGWKTRVGSFKFPNCVGGPTPTPTPTVPTWTPTVPAASSTATPTQPAETSTPPHTPSPPPLPTATATATPPPECAPAWTKVPRSGSDTLVGVSIATSRDVWAAGGQTTLHWDGSAWTSIPIPVSSPISVAGIAAAGSNLAWAVAGSNIFKWAGAGWSQVPYQTPTQVINPWPTPYRDSVYFHAVAAASQNDAWAVGGFGGAYGSSCVTLKWCRPAAQHWDGTTWNLVNVPGYLPDPGGPDGASIYMQHYDAVAYVGSEVWMVGAIDRDPGQGSRPISARCTVMSCTTTSLVQVDNYTNLVAVSGASTNDVWAVGMSRSWFSPTMSLIQHWNGTQWSLVPHPNVGSLTGVTAIAQNNVWAVGPGAILHYDGTSWTKVDALSGANAIDSNGPNDVWAVGTNTLHYPDMPRFTDVLPDNPFYVQIQYLACIGAISGYADGTFRWGNSTTRAQLCKILVLAEGWPIDTMGGPHFQDVPPDHPFYAYIETMYNREAISGYACGGPGEPCIDPRPYFRPYNNITRGQLCKVIVLAEGWEIDTTGGPHFVDVPPNNVFYDFIETSYNRGIISGYADGTFRWGNNATRGQISKIVYNAITVP